MKNFILVCMFFSVIFCNAQTSKDSLLTKDYNLIKSRLMIMHYLDTVAMKLMVMAGNDDEKEKYSTDFKSYYTEDILKNNDMLASYVYSYFGKYAPKSRQNFIDFVFKKNVEELIKITEKYGYPSLKRIKISLEDGDIFNPLNFTIRKNSSNKKLLRLFKKENATGNMPDADYKAFKILFQKNVQFEIIVPRE